MTTADPIAPRFPTNMEAVASAIRSAHAQGGAWVILDVGRILVEQLYQGDLEALRARSTKQASIRRLASEHELPMSTPALYRAAAIYELCRRLGNSSHWQHLRPTHLRTVLGLPDALQRELLETAEREHWSVSALEVEVARRHQRRQTSRGGRPRQPRFVKSLNRLSRYCASAAVQDVESLSRLDARSRRDAHRSLCDVIRQLERIEQQLRPPVQLVPPSND